MPKSPSFIPSGWKPSQNAPIAEGSLFAIVNRDGGNGPNTALIMANLDAQSPVGAVIIEARFAGQQQPPEIVAQALLRQPHGKEPVAGVNREWPDLAPGMAENFLKGQNLMALVFDAAEGTTPANLAERYLQPAQREAATLFAEAAQANNIVDQPSPDKQKQLLKPVLAKLQSLEKKISPAK